MDREAQRYYDTMQRRQLEGTNNNNTQQSTTTSDAIDVLVSGSTTIRPKRRAESSAVAENRRKQMGSTGFLFGTSRRRVESSQVEENRRRQMGSTGVFGGSQSPSHHSNVKSMSPKNNVTTPASSPRQGGYGHRKLRAVEQQDQLMREREKAMQMKQVLDAQIEEKKAKGKRESA